jgi:outer membrane protein TolC
VDGYPGRTFSAVVKQVRYGPETVQGAATEAAQRSAELAQDQYTSGLIDFQAVLDSQRSVRTFQDQLAQSKGQVTINLISLYKALGGGWDSSVPITS